MHLVTPAAYLFVARMDGRRTVDEIWQSIVAEAEEDAPGQDAAIRLLMQLHGADLLACDVPPDAAELLSRRARIVALGLVAQPCARRCRCRSRCSTRTPS